MLENYTIAAISTPLGAGGIGIVRMSGEDSFTIANKIFEGKNKKDVKDYKSHTIHYGRIVDPKTQEVIDEVLLSILKGPHTYTKENMIEINCHGGLIVVQKILQLVLREGAQLAEPGEFTKRAFLNGRIDLSQAEAVIDVINAQTELALQSSVSQLGGGLSEKVKVFRQELLEMIAHIEASIDYPEHDMEELTYEMIQTNTEQLLEKVNDFIQTADTGRMIKEGIQTVIIGKPNVGKSSLLNALLREQRAIVTNIPGTTRDILEEYVNIQGVPLKIVDTAGIRQTEDVVEQIGVEKSKSSIPQADLILVMMDASTPWAEEDHDIFELIQGKQVLVLINKTDLPRQLDIDLVTEYVPLDSILEISIKEKIGLDLLEKTLKEMFFKGEIKMNETIFITNVRHKDALVKSKESLETVLETIELGLPEDCLSIDLQSAYEYLGEITGETVGESLIDQIFSQFCLGK
ncbi:MAG: tRNA uridine-5-carboxymethylaminomethyl(34) synthesis GTPase MnmE [Epulopiscium sp.]|nr:tRNA uridine-5-carboxymethylaminomethyl(34) synthesis GTPase MnmE [Candidatus Epulonipiscium sp.]